MADYTIQDIYQGGYSSLDPNSSYGSIFTGYSVPASQLGAPTKIDTANQIQQVNMLLNQGIIPIEVGALDPKIFDQIPKEHFKEINRMMKLTGGKVSLHAPIIEPTGVSEQGWSESSRKLAEEQIFDVVERSRELDPNGGMPITIHSTGLPGAEYIKNDDGTKIQKLSLINQETGKIIPIEEERRYRLSSTPEELAQGGELLSPIKEIQTVNYSEWQNSLSELIHFKEEGDKIIREIPKESFNNTFKKLSKGEGLSPEEQDVYWRATNAQSYFQDSKLKLQSMFNKAYKYGNEEERKLLQEGLKKFQEDVQKKDFRASSFAIQDMISTLESVQPNIYVPVEKFALDKASETFSNVALKTYDKYGSKSPSLDIENMFAGMAFGLKGKEGIPGMNELILESKHKFIDNAVKSKSDGGLGLSKEQAKNEADRLIGMTLDTGHLNVAKKYGYEDKDLAKEVAEIAKHVKHIHLTDNFGWSDSHLPPGMGNVPFKKILEELEKEGTLGKSRKVVEASGWPQHFGSSPLSYTLAGMGAKINADSTGPYWNQSAGLYQGYFGGFGMMLPQINYQTFGAGFSRLPSELGGQVPGAQGSRLSGNPME